MIKINTLFRKLKISKTALKKFKKISKPIVYAFAIIGFIASVAFFSILRFLGSGQSTPIISVPDNAIITINFNQSFNEGQNDSLLSEFNGGSLSYFDMIKYLNTAIFDDNVKGLAATINTTGLGLSQIQNLRQTIQNFRTAGKKTYIFSSGMGDLGQGTDEYYLATAFEKIYMQPNSDLGITGINIEVPFANDGLHKLGLDAEFYTRYEYKNAASSLTNSHIPPTYKQQLTYVGKTIYNQIRDDIAQSRNLSPKQVDAFINKAPLSAEEAVSGRLIDEVLYYSEAKKQIIEETKGKFISLENYGMNFAQEKAKHPAIAYMTLEGTIVEGNSSDAALSGELMVGVDTVVKNIKEIAKNKSIKALILRINSPGGSYAASNTIWHELMHLKQSKNIPIVVSMGDYAASGGYFVALSGDKVFAEPLTLTGSIGVLGGKMVVADLWEKLGINWAKISFGNNAGITSPHHKLSASEKKAFNRSLDNIYKDFTEKVSAARNINIKTLDNLARGRIWLGTDAAQNGLIDDIGGIEKALAAAKELGGIRPKEKFDILLYPKPKTFAEKISEFMSATPQVVINRLASKNGLDIQELNVLKQMQYNCITVPFLIYK